MRQRPLHGEVQAFQVNVDHVVEEFLGGVGQRRTAIDPGVGEQHVDTTDLGGNLRVHPVDLGNLADIGADGNEPVRAGLGVEGLLVSAHNDHPRPFLFQAQGRRKADTTVATRDHRGLSVKAIHLILLEVW